MYNELEEKGRVLKMDNFEVVDDKPSGLVKFACPNDVVHSSFFSPVRTNSIFMVVNVEETPDENNIQTEKIADYLNKYIKYGMDGQGPSLELINENYEDSNHWYPTSGDGFITIQHDEKMKGLKGVSNHVIIAYITYPLLSAQFREYLQKNVDGNGITFENFTKNDKMHHKFVDLAKRNAQRLIYDFSVILGLKINVVFDQNAVQLMNHAKPYLAIPACHWWINKLETLKNGEYAYNDNVVFNSKLIDKTMDNVLNKYILYKEDEISKKNNYDNIYPFISGLTNKILLVCANDGDLIGFPFCGVHKKENENKTSKYLLSNIKDIEKRFISTGEFNFEETEIFTNYEELFGNKYSHKKIYLNPVIMKIK